MTSSKFTISSLALIAGVALSPSAFAAISVTNSIGASFSLGTTSLSLPAYGVTNANSIIVVGVYIDNGSNTLSNVSFGGQAADGVITAARAKLYYFNNPAVGSSTFTATSNNTQGAGNGYFLWELAGVDLSASPVSASATDASGTITTNNANSFVVDFFTFNNGGLGTQPETGGLSSVAFTTGFGSNLGAGGSGGGGYIAAGSISATTIGTYNLGWALTDAASGNSYGEVAFAFAPSAVPEPSSFAALAGLGALGAVMARRRRR